MNKLKFLILHCTATPEGRTITGDDIRRMHLGPCVNADGSITYKGKKYANLNALPVDKIGGVPIRGIRGRGWDRVGYSDLIQLNGTLENLTPYDSDDNVATWELTYGTVGMNAISRHVVYAGGCTVGMVPKDTRTQAQLLAMGNYIKQVVNAHPDILIAGHNQFANKACPSFDVPAYLVKLGISNKNIYRKP